MPTRPVAILHLEDSSRRQARRASAARRSLECEITVVDTRWTFTDALIASTI
jgi:hypothetical protein